MADAERLVTSGGLRFPAFRLAKAGEELRARDYTVDLSWRPVPLTGTIEVARVAEEFGGGATIVLQALHLQHAPLARFSRELEQALSQPVQVNAYYTPQSAQGLPVHHDTHDVFCLQVAGAKRWLVYAPLVQLPLKDQHYRPELGDPGGPVLDVTLSAGDTLYLPRGWLHEALTSESDSLHLTVGLIAHTWLDALRAALDDCRDDIAFRRSVPEDAEAPADLFTALEERLAPADVSRRRRARFVAGRRPILGDQLAQVRTLEHLTVDTPIERRDTVIADLAAGEDSVTLSFEGKELVFPSHAREELEALYVAAGLVTPRELPGDLDDEGRLVLVRRLVREGFLRAPEAARDGSSPRSGGAA